MRLANGTKQPICAGVLISEDNYVLFVLGTEDRWGVDDGVLRVPVTGVGGGQLPGETMWQCAIREAREEIACEVTLVDSRITYLESQFGEVEKAVFSDTPAPLLYQVQKRPTSKPFAPGLPAGELLHIGIFRAITRGTPSAGDVPGLLWVPYHLLHFLSAASSLESLCSAGCRLALAAPAAVPMSALIVLPQQSTERFFIDLVSRYGVEEILACKA